MLSSSNSLECPIFRQELAPFHCSKKMQNLFKESGIYVLEWPGNSPDITILRICGQCNDVPDSYLSSQKRVRRGRVRQIFEGGKFLIQN